MRQNRSVHRSRTGAGNRLDVEPAIFKQLVQYTPGEGAVRTAPLQGEIDAATARDVVAKIG